MAFDVKVMENASMGSTVIVSRIARMAQMKRTAATKLTMVDLLNLALNGNPCLKLPI
jgi:hypothetical protein